MATEAAKHSLVNQVRQSPPFDVDHIPNDSWIRDKVIIITGGASGFGEGFTRRWAKAGACLIVGDINVAKGDRAVRDIRTETGNNKVHFIHCDVADWQSQVNLFREAVKLSPHGGIDVVVANAGTATSKRPFESPEDLEGPSPPPPDLSILDVNATGVLYTSYLALWYLPRNPGSAAADPHCDPSQTHRDRHLILMSSVAGLMPIPTGALYGTSKHAVVGLYRNLRATSYRHGIRVNMLCPYFIETPLLHAATRALLAGGTTGSAEDVVEAATRFAANPRVIGRAVIVNGKMPVKKNEDGEWFIAEGKDEQDAEERAIWEVYAHDFEDSDVFQRRILTLMNRIVEIRGWIGWIGDIVKAVRYGLGNWWGRK